MSIMISPETTPRPMKSVLSDDDMSVTSGTDGDIGNEDLRRMSMDAMKMLQSISDEVNQIHVGRTPNKRNSSSNRSSRSSSRSGSPLSAKNNNTDNNSNNSANIVQHIDDLDVGSDEEDEDADHSFSDDSFVNEMNALHLVTEELERELRDQNSQTMEKTISKLDEDDADVLDPRQSLLSSDDHDIIERIMHDEIKNYVPKNALEKFLKKYRLEGLGETEIRSILTILCVMVWATVYRMFQKVMYGEI